MCLVSILALDNTWPFDANVYAFVRLSVYLMWKQHSLEYRLICVHAGVKAASQIQSNKWRDSKSHHLTCRWFCIKYERKQTPADSSLFSQAKVTLNLSLQTFDPHSVADPISIRRRVQSTSNRINLSCFHDNHVNLHEMAVDLFSARRPDRVVVKIAGVARLVIGQ